MSCYCAHLVEQGGGKEGGTRTAAVLRRWNTTEQQPSRKEPKEASRENSLSVGKFLGIFIPTESRINWLDSPGILYKLQAIVYSLKRLAFS